MAYSQAADINGLDTSVALSYDILSPSATARRWSRILSSPTFHSEMHRAKVIVTNFTW
jgi:hypothetical protein